MEQNHRGQLGIIACKSGKNFAEKVDQELAKLLETETNEKTFIRKSHETHFANYEIKTTIEDCVRYQDIYVFQDCQNNSTHFGKEKRIMSINDNFFALATALDATKRADAHYVTAVIPSFPYARQDRRKDRESLTAKMVALFLEATGVNRVVTLDIHNDAISGYFGKDVRFENLRASVSIMDYIKNNLISEKLIICAPDTGGADRTNHYAQHLGKKLVLLHKERDYTKANTIAKIKLLGNVRGKDVLLIDDMIDTAGTLIAGAKELKSKGANNIYFAASLAIFSNPATERLNSAYNERLITKIIGTNAIYHSDEYKRNNPWYTEVPLEKYFAEVIYRVNRGKSIRELLK